MNILSRAAEEALGVLEKDFYSKPKVCVVMCISVHTAELLMLACAMLGPN
jgi:hypothetical protein